MRRSSPRSAGARAVGVAAAEHQPPAPQPLGLRHPAAVTAGVPSAIAVVRGGRPSIARTVASPAAARSSSTSSPIERDALDLAVAEQPAELAALGRLEGAERPAQQGDDVANARAAASRSTRRRPPAARCRGAARCRCRRGTPRRTRRPSAAGVPGVRARPRRRSTCSASSGRRRAAAGSPALDEPVDRAGVGQLLEHGGSSRRRAGWSTTASAAWTALIRSTIAGRRVVVEAARARSRPARPARRARRTRRAARRVGAADVAVAQRRASGPSASISSATSGASAASSPSARTAGPSASRRSAEQRQLDHRGGVGQPVGARRPARRARTWPRPRRWCRGRPARRAAPTARAPSAAATSRGTCRSTRAPPRSMPHGTPSATSRCSRCERRSPFGVRRSSSTVRGAASGFSRAARWAAARSRASGTCGASAGTSPMASPTTSSSSDERQPAEHGLGGVEHLGQAGPRPVAQRGQRRRQARRGDEVVGRRRQAVAAQGVGGVDEEPGDTRPGRDGGTRGRTSPGWRRRRRSRWPGRAAGASTAPT